MSDEWLVCPFIFLPMTRQKASKLILKAMGVIFGFISILGGIAAWLYGHAREPERYWVAAFVTVIGGALWILYSKSTKYQFSKRHVRVILVTLLLGLALGLFYTFSSCGGECGGSFCRWEHGYPGRWFIVGGCYSSSDTPLNFQWTISHWHIDGVSLLADVAFWSAAGLIVAFLWQIISHRRSQSVLQE